MEENYQEKEENSEKGTVDEGALDSSEEAFMQGYNEEGEVAECPECSSAINPEKAVTKVIDEEKITFCSNVCAQDYEESIGD